MDDVPQDVVTLRQLLKAGVHFGHQTNRWNPKMRPFIFGARNGVHIIDLRQTLQLFKEAYRTVMEAVANGGTVLFVGTKRQAQDTIAEEAQRCGMYYVTHRWLGGMLTNFQTIKGSLDRLRGIERMAEDGTYEKLLKKEVMRKERERAKLMKNLGGIRDMTRPPAVVYVIDPVKERIAVAEANKLGIPVVAITDTNADPDKIDFVIPGNDDAIRAIRLFTSGVADACLEGARLGRERAVKRAAREEEMKQPDTIRVASGGDGPKVEVISRRSRPAPVSPEASGRPADEKGEQGEKEEKEKEKEKEQE
jgi:small subunit ribosomal protein S2